MPGDVPLLFGGEGTEGILSYKTIKELQLTLGKACQKSVKKVESISISRGWLPRGWRLLLLRMGASSRGGVREINRVAKQRTDLAQSKLLIIQRTGSHR